MIRAYIACSYVDRELYERIYAIVTGLGLSVTYRWVDYEPPPSGKERHEHRREQTQAEVDGVASADILIVGLPGRYGTATEIGVALASEIPIVLFGKLDRDFVTKDPANIFLDHPLVLFHSEDEEDLTEDIKTVCRAQLLDRMNALVRIQLGAPYDSWSTAEHRAALKDLCDAVDRLDYV